MLKSALEVLRRFAEENPSRGAHSYSDLPDIDFNLPLPRPGRLPHITEEQLDNVDKQLKDTEIGKVKTIAPGKLKRKQVQDAIHGAKREIEKLRKFLDNPGDASSDDVYYAIKNLHRFEEFMNEQNKTAASVADRFIKTGSKKPLYGHTDVHTAYMIDDYPHGFRDRCKRRVWLEFKPKQGWRFMAQTSDSWMPGDEPAKDAVLHWAKPKPSTYAPVAACMYLDAQDHVQWDTLGLNAEPPRILEFMGDFPKADFTVIKELADYRIRGLVSSLLGRAVRMQDGQPVPYADHELGKKRDELEQWAKVMKEAGGDVSKEVKDLVDGTAKPQQFDPEAFAKHQQQRKEKIEQAKADAAEAPGALNFDGFEARLRSKLHLEGRSLVVKPGTGNRRVWIVYHNVLGTPPSGQFGGNRQEYIIEGFDADRPVDKIKFTTENSSIKKPGIEGDYSMNMKGYKATMLKGKTAAPEKIADYLAAHINSLVKDIPAAPSKTATAEDLVERFLSDYDRS